MQIAMIGLGRMGANMAQRLMRGGHPVVGFDPADAANATFITVSPVINHPNRLQVTVGRNAPIFLMELFGFKPYVVKRTAIATYLPPISLGEPGSQMGGSLGEMGRTRSFFLRTEGWATDRGEGDAFTPNPLGGAFGPSDDVHRISVVSGTLTSNPLVSDRGGYEYRITVPAGGPGRMVQVYNAAFSPDGNGGSANYCDNNNVNSWARTCSSGGNNWYHENDGSAFNINAASNYSTMRYSLYRVDNPFIRNSDVLLSQLTVYPIDARRWNQGSNQYLIMGGPRRGQTVTQQYLGSSPSNMLIYHNWIDVATYMGAQDNGLVSLQQTGALGTYYRGGGLVAGTYRLRVDNLDNMGTTFTGSTALGHKGYAVRALNGDLSSCATCEVAGWDEICFFTPFESGSGGSFTMSLFQLPPDYAGLTVNIDIFDVGDVGSSNGYVKINILDPSGAVARSPKGINIYDLGARRSNLGARNYTVLAGAPGNTNASFVAEDTTSGQSTDNRWIHVELPIPDTYNPPPGQYWWSMQYLTGPGTVATDTVTVAVGLKGGPVHLVP